MNDESRTQPESRKSKLETLTDVLVNNRTALLITCGSDHVIRSRPMININDRFNGDLFFLVKQADEICRSLRANPQCNVSISEPSDDRFASIAGQAEILDDPKRIELMWNDDCRNWFEMDAPTSEFQLIRIDVQEAEFWERNTSLGRRIGQLLTGSNPTASDVDHKKVDWNEPALADPTQGDRQQEGDDGEIQQAKFRTPTIT